MDDPDVAKVSATGLNPDKPELTNYNHQISNKIKCQLFGILNLGHCDLFGICVLLFEIFYY